MKPANNHRQICEVYGENGTSHGMVRKWVSKFHDGRDNVLDETRSGRPSVVSGAFTGGHVLRQGDTETGARYDKCLNNGGNYVEK
jgi:transposase